MIVDCSDKTRLFKIKYLNHSIGKANGQNRLIEFDRTYVSVEEAFSHSDDISRSVDISLIIECDSDRTSLMPIN
jgi:hypothetical protein